MPNTQPAKSSSNGCLIVIIVFLLLVVAGIAGLYVIDATKHRSRTLGGSRGGMR